MTTTTVPALTETDHLAARRLLVPVAIVTGLATTLFGVMRANSEGEAVSMVLLALVANALVFGLVVPRGLRHEAAPVRALVMGVFGLLLVPVAFWSGLPIVLGGGAVLLGLAGRRASARSGLCIAALIIGALAVIGYLGIYVEDWITDPSANWWS